MKKLLVVVDMQNDFVRGTLGSADAVAILPNVIKKLRFARENGVQIAFTRDTHFENYSSTQEGEKLPVLHCVKDTYGWEIVDGLYEDGEKVFDKPTFGSLELAKFVQGEGFDEVELIGVCTDICVVSNALLIKAYCPEVRVQVSADCCAGVSKESHDAALKTMSSCQVEIL
ncbi:MAG: cysteine hydrolase [Clostridia bacterium]|nr:cysteine hydrolase [Clostridia bacterium]